MNIKLAKQVAIEAIKNAGEILVKGLEKTHQVNTKDNHYQVVTKMDIQSQKIIVNSLLKYFPECLIYSEELKNDENIDRLDKFIWIIDPIDGSANYISHNPYFCITIALQFNKETILAVTYFPVFNDLFIAEKNKGALYNGKQTKVTQTQELKKSIICVDWNHYKNEIDKIKIRDILFVLGKNTRKVLTYGSGASSATHVANGMFDAYFNLCSHLWDHAGPSLIVEEAGGKATTIKGAPQKGLTNSVLVSNGKIHQQLLEIINNS